MLVGRVVDHHVDQDPDAALTRRVGELDEVTERPIAGVDTVVV